MHSMPVFALFHWKDTALLPYMQTQEPSAFLQKIALTHHVNSLSSRKGLVAL